MFTYIYLIISLIIFTYLIYRTITNMIRHSKNLPTKKYRFMYLLFFNDYADDDYDHVDYVAMLTWSVFLAAAWGIHWAIYIIYISWKRIVIPLLTRLTLSKEERVQVALGATPNKEEGE